MATNTLEIKDRVQRYLTALVGSIDLNEEGDMSVRYGSARVFVRVLPHTENATVIRIFAPFLFQVPPSPELFEKIACEGSFLWGSIQSDKTDEGCTLFFGHTLLGDFLDQDELNWAVGAIASTADSLDDEYKDLFGGVRFHED